jgi:hypothetical protein
MGGRFLTEHSANENGTLFVLLIEFFLKFIKKVFCCWFGHNR